MASAGGAILENPDAGRDVRPALASPAGEKAAGVIRTLGRSKAASADLNTSHEGTAQAGFHAKNGGFMINWPFVYTAEINALMDLTAQLTISTSDAARSKLRKAITDHQARIDDSGWTRWPSVVPGRPSAPPLGGINIAIGAFTKNPDDAVDAVRCLTSPESQKTYMLGEGLLSTIQSVYDDHDIQKAFPKVALVFIRQRTLAPAVMPALSPLE